MKGLRGTAAVLATAILAAWLSWLSRPASPPPSPAVPELHRKGGYLGSDACAACHPGEHASWKKSYHQSMTRRAERLNWDGKESPELPAQLELGSRTFHLSRDTDGIAYRGPDLHHIGKLLAGLSQTSDGSHEWRLARAREFFATAREVNRRIVLVTGSHHYLAFWVEGGDEAELRQLPFVYLLDEKRFLPRKDAFLQPPDALPHLARFNANCIQCHTVAGRPEQSEGINPTTGAFWDSYKSEVAELGIACESCHGPGSQHAEGNRNPWSRSQARKAGKGSHIYLPSSEAGVRGSETCGQCHSYFIPSDPNEWWTAGFSESYSAGDSLSESRRLLRPPRTRKEKHQEMLNQQTTDPTTAFSANLKSVFWDDGSILVGGREYNGLIQSPCFQEGTGDRKLACTSCHSIHDSPPDGQISRQRPGNTMCTQCHQNISEEHSRHSPASAGSRCTGCHMPRRSYALLQGITSHQVSSPGLKFSSPPHACALCHVDRSQAWFIEELKNFGVSAGGSMTPSDLHGDHELTLPLAAIGSLKGNAAERAVYAFALGTPEALNASGINVPLQLLPWLKDDPYAAVRLIARRSLSKVEEYSSAQDANPALPKSSQWRLLDSTRKRLIEERDNTPIVVSE